VQSPGNRALLFVRGRCQKALRFVSSLLGEKNPHKNIGTVGPLSIQGEGGGEGPRAHGVTVGSGRDGLAALALRAAHSLRSWSVQLATASCRTLGRGSSFLPQACYMRKKARIFMRALILNMAVREGLTRFARPTGSPLTAFAVCPTGCRPLSNSQSRVLIPPFRENINEKSPYFRTSSFLEYGGEGGIDSLRSPYGQPVRYALRLSNWLSPVVEPSVEGSHPSLSGEYKRKKPVLSYELSSEIWR